MLTPPRPDGKEILIQRSQVTIQHFFPKKPKKVLDTVFLKISIFRYHLCGFFETPLLSAIAAPHDIQPFFAVAG